MSAPPFAHLAATCSSLAQKALSGAREADRLADGDDDVQPAKFQLVRYLSVGLQQLSKDADRLQDCLSNASVVSPALQDTIHALLPEIDAAVATVIKQIMRLERDTPREAINAETLVQYKSSLESIMRYLTFMATALSIDSIASQDEKLEVEDAKLLVIRTASACQEVGKSPGVLMNLAIGSPQSSSKQNLLDTSTLSSSNDAPPPSYDSVLMSPTTANDNTTSSKRESSGGFLGSITSSFRAVTASMRTKPEPLVVPLCQAAAHDNISQMKSFLNEGVNINGRNEDGQTALICAVLCGHLNAVQVLLEAGADHATCNSGRKGKPPLFHAIETENKAMVDFLLARGAAANQTDDSWGQPFFIDVVTGDTAPEFIDLLLSHGVDAGIKNMNGRPVVSLALLKRKKQEDRDEVVTVLLRHGASPNSSDWDGTPLIHSCVQQKRGSLVRQLLSLGADPNARDINGTPLLVTVVKRNDRALAKLLLGRGADPNARELGGSHVLSVVLADSKIEDKAALVELLLQYGAHGFEKDSWGVTPLEHSLAATLKGGDIKIPKLLLKYVADPNQRLVKQSGEPTLLVHAIDRGRWDLVTMTLSHGANPNLADKEGRTPLLLAVERGSEQAVTLLIKHGADVNYPRRKMPLDLAEAKGNTKIARLLKTHGAITQATESDEK